MIRVIWVDTLKGTECWYPALPFITLRQMAEQFKQLNQMFQRFLSLQRSKSREYKSKCLFSAILHVSTYLFLRDTVTSLWLSRTCALSPSLCIIWAFVISCRCVMERQLVPSHFLGWVLQHISAHWGTESAGETHLGGMQYFVHLQDMHVATVTFLNFYWWTVTSIYNKACK